MIIKELEFDLLWDLNPSIGIRSSKDITFEDRDKWPVINSIFAFLDSHKRDDTKFKLKIIGTLPFWIIGDLCWLSAERGDVKPIHFCNKKNGTCYTVPSERRYEKR